MLPVETEQLVPLKGTLWLHHDRWIQSLNKSVFHHENGISFSQPIFIQFQNPNLTEEELHNSFINQKSTKNQNKIEFYGTVNWN